jgi:hypothetical protein
MRPGRRTRSADSGRILLRLPPEVHAALRAAARGAGVSLNEHCARRLAAAGSALSGTRGAAAIVGRGAALFGPHLLGVLVFGSWARGEAAGASDVDVLVVVDRAVELTRDLYRRWDTEPATWEGRPVDVHFAHLPEPGDTTAGVWAEVALDGIVLFERDLVLSAALARVRRDIAAGRIVRRVVHGQPYWVRAG